MSVRITAEPVARLIDEFNKLPSIGPKSAARLTYHLLRTGPEATQALIDALVELKERITFCSVCFNITEASHNPCPICVSPERDRSMLCVVEEPLDIVALERTREYKGLYHVLHGAINPLNGVGPDQLRIKELLRRVAEPGVREVILATNPNMEGEATAMHLFRQLSATGVRVTRPASGLPMGGDLEYADELTLSRALTGRREM
ncbi:MAG: recombination protein RecR [Chloroflexi bacterium]|nr:recombination protein RecR [Chloroflexota bacterium]